MNWEDVQGFIEALNGIVPDIAARLPTEAEWEYACRAGTDTPFSFGADITPEQVNYDGDYPYADGRKGVYRKKTVPVGSLSANAWGLYEMHGNVWEWCQDWYGDYPEGSVVDPAGPESGAARVVRGGSWNDDGRGVRYFSHTQLRATSLKRVVLYETVFADVDLSAARDLKTCVHVGPSILDHRTLTRSGDLPIEFLRGCGLPDFMINDVTEPRLDCDSYWSCFISYSSKDQEFADRLYTDLQAQGVRCWFAPKDVRIGDKIRDAIDEGIRGTERLLIVLSESAVSSAWVEKEVETAFEEERQRGGIVLFPIRLDTAVIETNQAWAADIRRMRHIGDFSRWKQHESYKLAFERLLRDLRRGTVVRHESARQAGRA